MEETLKALGIDLHGLKYDELNSDERKTLNVWLESLSKNELTVAKIREYVVQLKNAIEQEFTDPELSKKREDHLRARLQNMLLLEAFLLAPEKAKKALQQAIKGVK
jgi:hypothetical protein